MDTTFLQARKVSLENLIVAYETAITAVLANPKKAYTLDTGQDRVTVTNQDLDKLQSTLTRLYSLLSTICTRLEGAGGQMVPGW